MKVINIEVRNKIAEQIDNAVYVCGNSDFVVIFDFDEEWNDLDVKTARFIHSAGYTDVVFEGNACKMPVISNTYNIKVGVFAGNLCTTTPALVSAKKSILCEDGLPAAPTDDVYAQIMGAVVASNVKGDNGFVKQSALPEGFPYCDGDIVIPEILVDLQVINEAKPERMVGGFRIPDAKIEDGKEYTVIWRGELYKRTAKKYEWNGIHIILGNPKISHGADNGDPFALKYFPYEQTGPYFNLEEYGQNHTRSTVAVVSNTFERIDPRYMPEFQRIVLVSSGGRRFNLTVSDEGQMKLATIEGA